MLWKDLQKQSPDLTSTVDMIITRQPYIASASTPQQQAHIALFRCIYRERLKNEQRDRELTRALQAKEQEAHTLAHVCSISCTAEVYCLYMYVRRYLVVYVVYGFSFGIYRILE